MRGGGTVSKIHQNLTNFGLVGRETGDRRENKSLQAKSETVVSICDHCPTMSAFTECINSVEGSQRSIVLCFPLFRLAWPELTKNTLNCGGQAVCPISTKFFSDPIKDQRLEEPKVGFEHPRTDHMISENWVPIPSQNMHDLRTAWALVTYNVRNASNLNLHQSYATFRRRNKVT